MDGEVKDVKAVELGADMNGSCTRRSCGETVPKLDVELEVLLVKSMADATAGEGKPVEAPPSKAVKSSSSTSWRGRELVRDWIMAVSKASGDKPAAFIILAIW